MSGSVLVLGGNGRFGRHASQTFWDAGWRVTQYDRSSGNLMQAAMGQDLIVNGWNPPYERWAAELPGQTTQVIEAAQASGATIILPGNVYVYGAGSPALFDAGTPHAAQNPLGRFRIEMEAQYRASGVRVILLRAGDFIDSEASGNWFDKVIVGPIARGRLSYPGDVDVPHAWAWLPDLARATVALAEKRETLPVYSDVMFPGWTLTGTELAAACANVLGRRVGVVRMSWVPLYLAVPFWKMARHLIEMSYLWRMRHRIDPAGFDALLPEFRSTPVEEGLAIALGAHIDPDEAMAGEGQAVFL